MVVGSLSLFENIENENNRHDSDGNRYMKSALDAKKRLIDSQEAKMLAFVSVNDKPVGGVRFKEGIANENYLVTAPRLEDIK